MKISTNKFNEVHEFQVISGAVVDALTTNKYESNPRIVSMTIPHVDAGTHITLAGARGTLSGKYIEQFIHNIGYCLKQAMVDIVVHADQVVGGPPQPDVTVSQPQAVQQLHTTKWKDLDDSKAAGTFGWIYKFLAPDIRTKVVNYTVKCEYTYTEPIPAVTTTAGVGGAPGSSTTAPLSPNNNGLTPGTSEIRHLTGTISHTITYDLDLNTIKFKSFL